MESSGPRVACVVVTKGLDYPTAEERRPSGARYTRDAIRGMLQFMGCKPRHAYKAAQLVFQKLESFAAEGSKFSHGSRQLWGVGAHDEGSVYVTMPRSEFYELVCSTLMEYNYKYAPSSDEIKAACSLKERRRHIIVLLCGTSGSGKSTLASILASRLGISTVLSTDSVRHMMRSFTSAAETPLLFASTYEAGDALRKQQALDEARRHQLRQKQQQQQQQGVSGQPGQDAAGAVTPDAAGTAVAGTEGSAPPPEFSRSSGPGGAEAPPAADALQLPATGKVASAGAGAGSSSSGAAQLSASISTSGPTQPSPPSATASAHDQAIRGYKAQCELVSEQLEQLICGFEARRQSLVVEGVHLHVGLVMRLLQRHPGVVPFLVYIKSEGKHVERMAVRAKYMTLDPNKNKYVKNMRNIRWIQDYLFRKAEKHAIPCVENTNIDRSVGLIHLTLLGCLKRMMKGEQVLDAGSCTVRMLHNECTAVVESLAGAVVAPPGAAAAAASGGAGGSVAAAAAACAGTSANGAVSGAPYQRESTGSWQSALPGHRVLGSPRRFARDSAPVPGSRSQPTGEEGGGHGDLVLLGVDPTRTASAHGSGALAVEQLAQGGAASALHGSSSPQVMQPHVAPVGQQSTQPTQLNSCDRPHDLQQQQQHPQALPSPPLPPPTLSPTHSPLRSGSWVARSYSGKPLPPSPQRNALLGVGTDAGARSSSNHGQASPLGPSSTVDALAAELLSLTDIVGVEPGSPQRSGSEPKVGLARASSARAQPLASSPNSGSLSHLDLPLRADIRSPAAAVAAGAGGGEATCGKERRPHSGRASPAGEAALLSELLAMAGQQQQQLQMQMQMQMQMQENPPHNTQRRLWQAGRHQDEQSYHQQGKALVASVQAPMGCGGGAARPHRVSGEGTAPMESQLPWQQESGQSGLEDASAADALCRMAPGSPVYGAPCSSSTVPEQGDDAHDGDVSDGGGDDEGGDEGVPGRRHRGGGFMGRQYSGTLAAVASCVGSGPTVLPSPSAVPSAPRTSASAGSRHGIASASQVPIIVGSASPVAASSPAHNGPSPLQGAGPHHHLQPQQPTDAQQSDGALLYRAGCMLPAARDSPLRGSDSGTGGLDRVLRGPSASDESGTDRAAVSNSGPLVLSPDHGARAAADTGLGSGSDAAIRPAQAAGAAALSPKVTPNPAGPTTGATAAAAAPEADYRAASQAVAAAKRRFGEQCPDEVLRAVMQSAIFDEQMDGVTERQAGSQQTRQRQQPSGLQQPLECRATPLEGSKGLLAAAVASAGTSGGGGRKSSSGSGMPTAAESAAELGASEAGQAAGWAPQWSPAEPGAPSLLAPAGLAGAGEGRGRPSASQVSEPSSACNKTASLPLSSSPPSHPHEQQHQWQSPQGATAAGTLAAATADPDGAQRWGTPSALGGPSFLRTDSRRLGGSSSPSPSALSSYESEGENGSGADASGGGGRRHRDRARVGPLGRDLLADSDDPDGEGYQRYGYGYGGASPLQEYGSVYESATHDDMDEHGDEDEGQPLGRSNTMIRHLAGVMERHRMRASASALAAAAAAASGRSIGASVASPGRAQSHRPPPAASSGSAVRPLVGRRAPGTAGGPRVGTSGGVIGTGPGSGAGSAAAVQAQAAGTVAAEGAPDLQFSFAQALRTIPGHTDDGGGDGAVAEDADGSGRGGRSTGDDGAMAEPGNVSIPKASSTPLGAGPPDGDKALSLDGKQGSQSGALAEGTGASSVVSLVSEAQQSGEGASVGGLQMHTPFASAVMEANSSRLD